MRFNVHFKPKGFPSPEIWPSLKNTHSAIYFIIMCFSQWMPEMNKLRYLEGERKGEKEEIYRPSELTW